LERKGLGVLKAYSFVQISTFDSKQRGRPAGGDFLTTVSTHGGNRKQSLRGDVGDEALLNWTTPSSVEGGTLRMSKRESNE